MKNLSRLIFFALVTAFFGCSPDEDKGFDYVIHTFDFSKGDYGWEPDFTDYPVQQNPEGDSIYEWKAEYTTLPAHLGGQYAMMVSSNNVGGDLFMFLKKKISGLKPNSDYILVFSVDFATNATSEQSIVLKAGANPTEPKKVIDASNYTLNIDKGSQLTSGESVTLLGNIGTGSNALDFANVSMTNEGPDSPLIVRSNKQGEIWLIIGTDSAYIGVTTVFYKRISVAFSVSER